MVPGARLERDDTAVLLYFYAVGFLAQHVAINLFYRQNAFASGAVARLNTAFSIALLASSHLLA
jgi:hypothetical protein